LKKNVERTCGGVLFISERTLNFKWDSFINKPEYFRITFHIIWGEFNR